MSAQDKVTKEWNGMAGEWDDMAGGYRDEFVKILWRETGYTTKEDLTVLDFGCATGLLSEVIRKDVKQVVAMDVAPQMIEVLKEKIRAGEWKNVNAYCAVAAHLDQASTDIRAALDALKGKVDLIAASSVLYFVPEEDMAATMQFLSGLLKPGSGMLLHTDWPKGDEYSDGFTEEKAVAMYEKGGLQAKTTKTVTMKWPPHEFPVFVGVATKPAATS